MNIKTSKFLTFFVFCFLAFTPFLALAQNQVNIYFFWGEGCPHCAAEEEFLNELTQRYPDIKIYDYEVYHNQDNADLLAKTAEELGIKNIGVPFTVIGNQYFIGFDKNITATQIEEHVTGSLKTPTKYADFPLPVLAITLGALDGFNPCAMWTLLFLISLLLGMKNKRRMWILGSSFIIASALVYFLFMAAWLHLILFLGFIIWVRIAIGGIALFGGGYNLREFFTAPVSGCKIIENKRRYEVFNKLKQITQQNSFWLALGGIILLAFAVNLVELICSAGLPAIFTQVLAINNLATWQYYAYILLYIFFFMLDDLFVFFAAMITLQMTGITTKYVRYGHLIGGILMVAIGLLLIFKPELLMFG